MCNIHDQLSFEFSSKVIYSLDDKTYESLKQGVGTPERDFYQTLRLSLLGKTLVVPLMRDRLLDPALGNFKHEIRSLDSLYDRHLVPQAICMELG